MIEEFEVDKLIKELLILIKKPNGAETFVSILAPKELEQLHKALEDKINNNV